MAGRLAWRLLTLPSPEVIFEPDGTLFRPTVAALSPWSDEALHGGPPAMLLAREIERVASDQPMIITRMSVELLRPTGLRSLAGRAPRPQGPAG